MKKNILSIAALLVLATSAIFMLDACKMKNPTEGFHILIKADAVTSPSEFRIKDAKYGISPGFTSPIPVTISGPGAGNIYSSGGNRSISIFQGGINISVRKGTPVSESNPIKFNIEINAPGYLPVVYPVTLYSLNPISETITLVNFNDPPEGAASKTATVSTDPTGKTTTATKITVDTSATKQTTMSITIDSGTQLKDKDGNPVSGSIEAKIMQFTSETPESKYSLPGGSDVTSVKDANGNALPGGTFDLNGFVNIDMSVGGTSVKTFSQPMKVNMGIDGINPKTNAAYKVGDVLETYSRSAGDGEWVKEATVTIINDSSGHLIAPMLISHLSFWSAGFLLAPCGDKFQFKFGIPAKATVNLSAKVSHSDAGGNLINDYQILVHGTNDNNASLIFPVTTALRPIADQNYNFKLTGDLTFNYTGKLCGSVIDVGTIVPEDKMLFNIFLKCSNGNQVILPDLYRVYYIDDADYQRAIVPKKGSNLAHKVDPRDGWYTVSAGDSVQWGESAVEYVNDANPRNTLTLSKSELKVGHKYRFSVYYNDGTKESREDYLTDAVSQTMLDQKILDMVIVLSSCPIK